MKKLIDTVKIYSAISAEIYNKIYNNSIVKSSINRKDGQILYEIVNDHLEGSYSSSFSVRVCCSSKYSGLEDNYCIELEGSYHKIWKGYNSHNGVYNLQYIVSEFILLTENAYNIKLPPLEKWYLCRIDIAKCFDVSNQRNVCDYINSLGSCKYARRNCDFYADRDLYIPGTTSTLKIYNKLLDFIKHDQKKFKNTDFPLEKYINEIQGFIRFEVEIKKKKLLNIFGENLKNISVKNLEYWEFEKVWSDEFMKLLGILDNDLKIVKGKEEVKKRLITIYGQNKGIRLFNFYCSIQLSGIDFIKKDMSKSVFYRNIKDLKDARIDYSQSYTLYEIPTFWFNPFEVEEVI